ncbi:DUF4932 domain-containing protein [Spirosoma utsteinense]|uniref:DUF4932 domain-containing protein n=1 Tax=Spirosoma utsteinense TaxID=2585773 RepID=A0ABR6W476_9BACT|nr:DUF4932 domain-containing protein [Spirosoma utsteinense]MBC3787107.1 hypothetical protein [Spirosoma utsteinense]MBC3791343.1 hypothetical protein [Spirosoma utsteinense]
MRAQRNTPDYMKGVAAFLLIIFTLVNASGQTATLSTIRTKQNRIVMYIDGERTSFNGVNDAPKDFHYNFALEKPSIPFILVSEKDSVSLTLNYGVITHFQIIREAKGDTLQGHFTSHKLVKKAVFSDAYKKVNEGKTLVEIPEVYELINVVFALTDYGKTDAIDKDTEYYPQVMSHFSPYKNHPVVRTIDSLLRASADNYAPLKMDGYAYSFQGDKLVKSPIYDRISWGELNRLTPYVPLLESFARKSRFRSFFKAHTPYYTKLISDFQKRVNVATMKTWLEKQFPATHYSAVKMLFTPLVGSNQSANNFEDNGFKEAQAHINYPFISKALVAQPEDVIRGRQMVIAFTELNHSYLNPEADKYARDVSAAYKNRVAWITSNTPSSNYDNPLSCFEEYMNYGLVTLLFADLFDTKTFTTLNEGIESNMVASRGFRKFHEFNQELLRLYKNKEPGQTVADLYPAIIAWAAKQ